MNNNDKERISLVESMLSAISSQMNFVTAEVFDISKTVKIASAQACQSIKQEILQEVHDIEKGFLLLQKFGCNICAKLMTHLDDKNIVQESFNLKTGMVQHVYLCPECYPKWKEARINIFKKEDDQIQLVTV